jgi:hypothetical protein
MATSSAYSETKVVSSLRARHRRIPNSIAFVSNLSVLITNKDNISDKGSPCLRPCSADELFGESGKLSPSFFSKTPGN